MKGKNEDLFQYNTKVSVPFVISNKNYGILWDSYSYCRWGNPEDYLQLNRAFKLYDKDGKEGQLTLMWIRMVRRLFEAKIAFTLSMQCLRLLRFATRQIRAVFRTCQRALR